MIDQYKEAFKEEAYELLGTLEATLLELENEPTNKELIAKVFRALHTIKGSSGMFGFDEVTIFTHNIESLYDHVRNGDLKITKIIVDLTLKASDQIKHMLDTSDNGAKTDKNIIKEIVTAFSNIIYDLKSNDKPFNDEEIKNTVQNTSEIYLIKFYPTEDIFLSGTNPISLLNELKNWGLCFIKAHPENIPDIQNLDMEKCYIYWDIILVSDKSLDDIKDLFIFVQDDSVVKIDIIENDNVIEENHYSQIFNLLLDENEVITLDLVSNAINKKDNVSAKKDRTGSNQEKESKPAENDITSSVRVKSDKLDGLVNLVGELVTVQAHLSQTAVMKNDPDFMAIAEDIERLTWELRDNALKIRMVPIETIFNKFKRLVRDLSLELGKDVEFITEGGETELDKIVIEKLNDPLVHLIRNCIDHGIESSTIRNSIGKPETGSLILSAVQSGANVLISITDDGAGMDKDTILAKATDKGLIEPGKELSEKEIYNLVFTPGFSTAKSVTNVSGRGVGMDVVKKSIESMRGSVEIVSEKEIGTTIILKIPLSLAIIEGLLIKSGEEYFIIPLTMVEECIELSYDEIKANNGRQFKNVRGELIPYLSLRNRFEIKSEKPSIQQIVIVNINDIKTGIVVDSVIGSHQTVIKPLGKCFRELNDISGATIMGDGCIALILDVAKLIKDEEKVQKERFEVIDN